VSDTLRLPVSCNKDCGAGCPLLAHVEGGRLVRITDNPLKAPHMTGCVRGYQMPRVVYAPDRLRAPLIRAGARGSGQFREASWEEALSLAAERLGDIRARHGSQAVLRLGGSGSCRGAVHNTSGLLSRFLAFFGGATTTYSSYSSAASSFVTPFVYGTPLTGLDPSTLPHARMIVLWGANLADLRFGCETESWLQEAKDGGTEIVVIDPRRTRTMERYGTQWLPIRPGTDTALAAAVLHVLSAEGLLDREFIARYSVGMGELEEYVRGRGADGLAKTPAWAAAICGLPAEAIADFARRYGRAKPAALIPGLSIQRTIGGEDAARFAMALQVATGNVGRLGGSTGGNTWGRLPGPRCGALRAPAGVASPAVPVYRWPDAILEGTAGGYPTDIRATYTVGGNYLSQGSDIRKNIRAMEKVEFSVCHDYVLTPTARYCDVVFPATTYLERDDVVFPAGNYLFYSHQVVMPQHQARHDYDILAELADRLGFGAAFTEGRSAGQWLEQVLAASEIPDVAEFKRTGIYLGREQKRFALADFVADPVAHPLSTPSGRIEIASAAYAARTGWPAIPVCREMDPEPGYTLRLVTPHPRHRTHSQYDHLPWFREREPHALWIYPGDAAARGIADGARARVRSPQGELSVPVRVTEEIMPGVVSLLEGVWPDVGADGVDQAGSPNWLTSTAPTEPSLGARTHSVWVEAVAEPL